MESSFTKHVEFQKTHPQQNSSHYPLAFVQRQMTFFKIQFFPRDTFCPITDIARYRHFLEF